MLRVTNVSWMFILHFVHCCTLLLLLFLTWFTYKRFNTNNVDFEMHSTYGYCGAAFVMFLHFGPIVQIVAMSSFNVIGLLIYNCFENNIKLKSSIDFNPFICFRMVTRGNFPELIIANAVRNRDLCLRMGLKHFQVEVVTDFKIQQLTEDKFIKQIVVPDSYRTPNGSLYKARALQYALADDVSTVSDDDWIVHLDEESLLTPNSLKGIVNFVADGRYPLGQGLITYANEDVVNWFTTFIDAFRVADDLGKLRFQMKLTHRLILDWKGSFLVCKASVEKLVSFDNGPEGSIVEDICFGQKADAMGYRFNFIEGEIWEKSPFTFADLVKQRRRWIEGVRLLIYSSHLPWSSRLLFAWFRIGAFLVQTGLYYAICTRYSPLNSKWKAIFELTLNFSMVLFVYMHVLGAVKSYTLYPKNGWKKLLLNLLALPFIIVIHSIALTISFVLTFFTFKTSYKIVEKNYTQTLNV